MQRHRSLLLLLPVLLFSGCAVIQPAADSVAAEQALRSSLVGTWHPDPDKEVGLLAKSTYHEDGTLELVAYKSSQCDVLLKATGTWHVEGKELHILIQESERTDILPVPMEIVDEVVSIGGSSKVLRAKDDGDIQYRIKSDVCAG